MLTAVKFAELLNKTSGEHVISKFSQLREPYFKLILPLPRGRGETPEDTPTGKLNDDTIAEIQQEIDSKIKNPYHIIHISNANNIKISSIRELKKFLALTFDGIKYRIVFFHNAHLMSEEAQNALLKSLEEPPEGIIFIISTPFKERLLSTIKSRCWEVKFKPVKNHDIIAILTKYFDWEKNTAESISYFTDGSVEKAVRLNELDIDELKETVINIIRFSLVKKINTVWEYLNPYLKTNAYDYTGILTELLKKWLVDVISFKNRGEVEYFVDQKGTIEKFCVKYENVDIYETAEHIEELCGYLDKNVNLNIMWLNIIFELAAIGVRTNIV